MKNLFWATLLTGAFLVGCSKTQSNGNVNATANQANGGVCPAGSYYTNGQCFTGDSSQAASASLSNGFYADNYTGTTTLQITNRTKMKELYKLGMGVCDRAANNYGQANCDTYLNGYTDIIMQLPATATGTGVVTFIARPYNDPRFNFYGQLPNARGLLGIALGWVTGIYIPDNSYYQGAQRNPLQVQMAVSAINNDQGFQAAGYGDAWTGLNQTMLTIQVLNGSVTSNGNLTYALLIGNTQVAQGTMRRCQVANCGL